MAGGMVERLAAVIEDKCGGCDPRDDEAFLEAAEAAIAAMREPTEGMLLAGCAKAAEEQARLVEIHRKDVAEIWQAMIDEALKP